MIFRGQYFFLSNFYPAVIRWHGHGDENRAGAFPTAEHLYQAMKCRWSSEALLIRTAGTPGQAKRLGRRAAIRPDWNDVRVDVMREVVWEKFDQNKGLARQLLATGDIELIEDNNWGDRFWGRSRGEGENWLGRILMETRARLRAEGRR